MKNALHSHWLKALRLWGRVSRPVESPAPAPPADADWLADSAVGEEDPGASLEALQRPGRSVKGSESPPR